MRTVSMIWASPRPKCATRPCQPLDELLPEISRICQKVWPPSVALTRTFAPIPERLEAVPASFTLNHWFKVKLAGTASNRSGIGAKVRVKATLGGQTFWQMREISGNSSSSGWQGLVAHFGLGDAQIIDTVRIEWPSRTVQELHGVAVNQFLTVVEPPRLGGVARQADGSLQLNLVGAAGVAFRVEASSNLFDWTPLVTITN